MKNSSKKDILKSLCKKNKWDFSLFEKYVNLIEEKNKVMNLTGFSGERLWEEGIWESLIFMLQIVKDRNGLNILDIGAGAGFPSIPYALTKPKNKIFIYEPLQKRVLFLELVVNELNLNNYVEIKRTRVEEVKDKNLFDIVTARAVSSVRGLLMSSFHLVKLNGEMSLLKSKKVYEEIEEAQPILKLIDHSINIEEFQEDFSTREDKIVIIKKLRSTPPMFPFEWKEIKKVEKIK
ncbi:16S rRNA (guanine(527)-N(7))-methyltransferase RsmG [Mycoplasmopsis canis]|uniref:16S rRNA (guanine(527)-N(7))-methyltransferase RsmG n=1 Tax=Mycoplasmopsis canis TaxID=29555 RepID=UPI00025AEC9A|nr:16S rRNA (guanine(527)-N(7))-methyltransferase RsmG [Mycoplasmopsis canis]EIE41178.1 S-adenosyl-L-methionine dependent methyltransferase [Mycoplasmopsis canis UF33]